MADVRVQQPIKLVDPTNNANEMLVSAAGSGQVLITESVVPGTGATHLGKAEDAVHASGDTGVMGLAVQKAAPGNLAGADGDYEPLQVSAGRLWGSSVVTDVVPGAGATNLGKAEDAASASADVGVGALAVQKAVPANTAGTDGDYEFLQVSAGRLWCSSVVTDVVPGTAATNLGKAEDAAHASGDVGVMLLGVRNDANAAFVGTDLDYTPLAVDSAGNLQVDVLTGGSEVTPTSPVVDAQTSAAVAAGGTITFDTADVPTKLGTGVDVSASVAVKVVISLVANGAATTKAVLFAAAGVPIQWRPPHRKYMEVGAATAGQDGIRAVVTNMDTSEAADVYVTFYYQNN